jgi:hypothetical protein
VSLALNSLSLFLSLFTGKVEVTSSTTCGSLVNVGSSPAIATSWDTNHVEHTRADPLNCVVVTDIPTSQLTISALPSGYTLTATPNGSGYTSTVTVNGATVTATLPTTLTSNAWTIETKDSSGKMINVFSYILTNAT